MSEVAKCGVCGEPMPEGEEMFNYHGFSGPCPKPPLPRETIRAALEAGATHVIHVDATAADAANKIEQMLAELVEARDVLRELLPYCKTHISQESFRDSIRRAERLLAPKSNPGRNA